LQRRLSDPRAFWDTQLRFRCEKEVPGTFATVTDSKVPGTSFSLRMKQQVPQNARRERIPAQQTTSGPKGKFSTERLIFCGAIPAARGACLAAGPAEGSNLKQFVQSGVGESVCFAVFFAWDMGYGASLEFLS